MNRIVLAWLSPARLAEITVRYELYYRGFRAIGWDPVVVATRSAAEGFEYPVHTADDSADFRDPEFWAGFGSEVALAITWLGMAEELSSMRRAGMTVLSITDSYGVGTTRSHPFEWLRWRWVYLPSLGLRLRAAKYWLRLFLSHAEEEARPILASIKASDVVAFHSPGAVASFRRFSDQYGGPELADRFVVVPYPVSEMFCTGDVPVERANRIVAVCRWNDPQKDARLMVRTLTAYYSRGGTAEVVIAGRNGEPWFTPLARRFRRVRYVGIQSPEALRDLYRTSRVVLFTSRWETGPIAAGEALASGCTLVGPPLVNFLTFHLTGPYGEASRTRSARDLSDVLGRELVRWDLGERPPEVTARYWRQQLHPATVCKSLIAAAERVQVLRPHQVKQRL